MQTAKRFISNASVPSAQTTLVTPGVPVQLTLDQVPCAKVFLTAGRSNVGTLTVGDKLVKYALPTSGGDIIASNTMEIEVDDLNKIFIDGSNAGDTWSFVYLF